MTDDRHDSAGNQVPVFVDVQRHDRLNVEDFLEAVERSAVEIVIAFERKADEICDWVNRVEIKARVFSFPVPKIGTRKALALASISVVISPSERTNGLVATVAGETDRGFQRPVIPLTVADGMSQRTR